MIGFYSANGIFSRMVADDNSSTYDNRPGLPSVLSMVLGFPSLVGKFNLFQFFIFQCFFLFHFFPLALVILSCSACAVSFASVLSRKKKT